MFFAPIISGSAQVVGELYASKNYINHEVWWSKSFSDSSRFSFFSFNRFRINYEHPENSQFLNYSTLNYSFGKNLGVSGGGFLTQYGFSPIVALNFFHFSETWMIGLFPGVEIKDQPNADIFAFVQFRPMLNDRVRVFSQIIASSNFSFKQHNISEQSVRLGLDYKSFQLGYGFDLGQFTLQEGLTLTTVWTDSHGIFVRREF